VTGRSQDTVGIGDPTAPREAHHVAVVINRDCLRGGVAR
jgi:hypothetical protein